MTGPSAEHAERPATGLPAEHGEALATGLPAERADAVIAERRLPWPVAPGRVCRIPWNLFSPVDPEAGDVAIGLSGR